MNLPYPLPQHPNHYKMNETELVLVSKSELSAMRAMMTELHGSVALLVSQKDNAAPAQHKYDENGTRLLTDAERAYRISRNDVMNIFGVSERTAYRHIKRFNIIAIEEYGTKCYILGEILDIISRHGLNFHRQSLNSLLSKREIRYKPSFV